MDELIWTLPVRSQEFEQGPQVLISSGRVTLRWDAETETGDYAWSSGDGSGDAVEGDGVSKPFELPDQPAGVGFGVAFVAEPGRSEVLVGLVALEHEVRADQHRVRDRDGRPVVPAPGREPRELRS